MSDSLAANFCTNQELNEFDLILRRKRDKMHAKLGASAQRPGFRMCSMQVYLIRVSENATVAAIIRFVVIADLAAVWMFLAQ